MIGGFSYVTQKAVEQSLATWSDMMETVLDAGGSRRTHKGETFLHDEHGVLICEIYSIIPLRGVNDLL